MAEKSSSKVSKPRKLKKNGQRALKACDSCRRMKTRCIPSPLPEEVQCLRCDTFNLRCSFQDLLSDDEGAETLALLKEQKSSSGTGSATYESAELTKRLLKSGYSPEDFAVHAKLLQNVNKNVTKILELLANQAPPAAPESSSRPAAPGNPSSRAVSALTEAVQMMTSSSGHTLVPSGLVDPESREVSPELDDISAKRTEQRHLTPYLTCPFTMVSQMVSRENLPLPICKIQDHEMLPQGLVDDVVGLNLLTLEEVVLLTQDFRDGYGKWCSFPESMSTEKLVEVLRSRNASLLLSAICVLALRYTLSYHDLKTRIYKNLLYKLKSDLELSLRHNPHGIEFIQALVVLSMYASSYSSDIMSVDAWYLSGIGLQQFLTLNIPDALFNRENDYAEPTDFFSLGLSSPLDSAPSHLLSPESQFQKLQTSRLWNHLCLAHITNCVFSGRMCIVDGVRIDLCRRILDFPNSTNFDGRMVAEISMQLILYNFVQHCNVHPPKSPNSTTAFDKVHEELQVWIEEWRYLFSQPIHPNTQYAEFAYNYSRTIVLYTWYHRCYRARKMHLAKRARVNPSRPTDLNIMNKTSIGNYLSQEYPVEDVINSIPKDKRLDMLKHAHRSLETMINDNPENFRYLSDQLFFQCVHCSLVCLIIAHSLYHFSDGLLGEDHLEQILSDVKKYSLRLQKIREGELKSFWVEEVDLKIPSVILQYHRAIETCLQDKFPEYEIHVDDGYP